MDHHVGDSGEVTHVAPPGAPFSSKINRYMSQIMYTAVAAVYEVVNKLGTKSKSLRFAVMIFLLYFIIFFPGIQNLLDQHTLLEKLIDPQKEDR